VSSPSPIDRFTSPSLGGTLLLEGVRGDIRRGWTKAHGSGLNGLVPGSGQGLAMGALRLCAVSQCKDESTRCRVGCGAVVEGREGSIPHKHRRLLRLSKACGGRGCVLTGACGHVAAGLTSIAWACDAHVRDGRTVVGAGWHKGWEG